MVSFYFVLNLDDGTFWVKFDTFFWRNRGILLLGLETIFFVVLPVLKEISCKQFCVTLFLLTNFLVHIFEEVRGRRGVNVYI